MSIIRAVVNGKFYVHDLQRAAWTSDEFHDEGLPSN